jgi:NDP-sugar pyrophosphorylase family protein
VNTATRTAIITMAGAGSRFREAGYACPKYEIEVLGRSLFSWALESLRSFIDGGARFVFVSRAVDRAGPFVAAEAEALGVRSHALVELAEMTDGQATTALLAEGQVEDRSGPVLIYNIDTHVDPASLPAGAVRGDGWIPCFPGEGAGWSFARTGAEGRVEEVREKVRISPHATVGLYWFSSFVLYRELYESYYSRPEHIEKGERYIAPMYNEMVRRGLPVYIHEIPATAVTPLGTPAEVALFARTGLTRSGG